MTIRIAAFGAMIVCMTTPGHADEHAGRWYADYQTGREQAAASGLPLLLHFYADWCGPCRRMEATVLNSDAVLAQLGRTVIAVKVNVDHEPEVAARFEVTGLPADVLLSPEGTVLAKNQGFSSSAEYVALIQDNAIVKRQTQFVAAESSAKDETTSFGLNGFSPVAITRDHVWRPGDDAYQWSYRGIVYRLADADELRAFQAEPARYVPQLEGYDPLVLATEKQRIRGRIEFASFFQDGLYLHSSEENRSRFIASPRQYADRAESELEARPDAVAAAIRIDR